jgi:putative ABC transport system substrate-binding protein
MFGMRRREFIAVLGGASVPSMLLPLYVRAQQPERIRRIGILMPTTPADVRQTELEALRQRLAELGWMTDRNIRIEYRWGGGDIERTHIYAAELVRQSPDVIFACFNAQLAPLSRETNTIPIIFVGASDPVGSGYVASFARPRGNITGFTLYEPTMAGKWLGTLKEIAPALARIALMTNPDTATLRGKFYSNAFETAAASFTVKPITVTVRSAEDVDAVMTSLGQEADTGVIVAPETFTETHAELIVSLAERHRMPRYIRGTSLPEKRWPGVLRSRHRRYFPPCGFVY